MKIKQFRNVLEKVAVTYTRLGASDTAAALRALATTLKPHDKTQVQRLAADVKNLRRTGGKQIRRKRESA